MLAALGSAAASGLLASDAAAQVSRTKDEDDAPPALLVAPANAVSHVLLAHSSHSSHSSHRSHVSGSTGGGGGESDWTPPAAAVAPPAPPPPPPPPPPPKPARVAFAAYPGGKIYLNNNAIGHDQTDAMFLKPGRYEIRVENRFLGNHEVNVEVAEGQTGTIAIEW